MARRVDPANRGAAARSSAATASARIEKPPEHLWLAENRQKPLQNGQKNGPIAAAFPPFRSGNARAARARAGRIRPGKRAGTAAHAMDAAAPRGRRLGGIVGWMPDALIRRHSTFTRSSREQR